MTGDHPAAPLFIGLLAGILFAIPVMFWIDAKFDRSYVEGQLRESTRQKEICEARLKDRAS